MYLSLLTEEWIQGNAQVTYFQKVNTCEMYKLLDMYRNTNSSENKVAPNYSNELPHSNNVRMTNHLSKVT